MVSSVILGDCVEVMAGMDAESVDALVTDPPYGLEFMGKEWDSPKLWDSRRNTDRASLPGTGAIRNAPVYQAGPSFQAWCTAWATEALRVTKPGGYLLAFGGTRTVHRLTCALEDAGWEIRDCLVWAYASGFPKSLDVSKAIDKAAGAEREVVGPSARHPGGRTNADGPIGDYARFGGTNEITAPATDGAKRWQGWGTALKPAWEPIVMARKPLRGTVAANVLAHGTGALNIDATRIGTDTVLSRKDGGFGANFHDDNWQPDPLTPYQPHDGRWPPNLLLTDPLFDGGVDGVVGGGSGQTSGWRDFDYPYGSWGIADSFGAANVTGPHYGDSGTYSRFFLIPKSARSEREPVLGGLPLRMRGTLDGGEYVSEGRTASKRGTAHRANTHPTVKPVDLMRHLVRLVTPPGGVVLDPFLGSGSTAIACEMEGFAWIGIEKEPEYVAIAEARLNGTQRGMGLK